MVAVLLGLEPGLPESLPVRAALQVALGALVYAGCIYGIWALRGRPDGIERRLVQWLAKMGRT